MMSEVRQKIGKIKYPLPEEPKRLYLSRVERDGPLPSPGSTTADPEFERMKGQ